MNAHRFDLLVTWALLAFGVWYGLQMLSYPDDAGVVPAIAAAIMVAALLVQLVVLHRKRTAADEEVAGATVLDVDPPTDPAPTGHRAPALEDRAELRHAAAEVQLEQDSYESLIALRGVRRRRFLAIAGYSCAFYVGYLLVGFVATTGLLIAGILVVARERPHVVVIAALVGAASAYALVVGLLGIPAMSGYLVP